MICDVTDAEIKNVVFDIDDAKSLRLDGFTLAFFKKSCRIIGKDICSAIKDLFKNGKLLGEGFAVALVVLNVEASQSKQHDISESVMHAYDAIIPPQVHIAPPTVLPPSPVLPLSLMFNPQDLFLPKEILPPCKQAHFLSLSSIDLSAQPQAFKIGENYYGAQDTSHTCHKERIKDILNHLDELSLDHIKEMEGHVNG
nr:RNA-directed DNA polymerase, eukaryota, reverse transcriptase zinc-binding domain protein [Tanacetum cinerariifolium]